MADTISAEKRKENMQHIKGKDTSIEIKVRKYLFAKGYRFRKNVKKLPGTPDVVLPKYKTVIFIHGCFWHSHPYCKIARIPKSNTDFWVKKLTRNVENDKKHITDLEKLGYNVIVLWECELKKDKFDITMQRVINELDEIWIKSYIV